MAAAAAASVAVGHHRRRRVRGASPGRRWGRSSSGSSNSNSSRGRRGSKAAACLPPSRLLVRLPAAARLAFLCFAAARLAKDIERIHHSPTLPLESLALRLPPPSTWPGWPSRSTPSVFPFSLQALYFPHLVFSSSPTNKSARPAPLFLPLAAGSRELSEGVPRILILLPPGLVSAPARLPHLSPRFSQALSPWGSSLPSLNPLAFLDRDGVPASAKSWLQDAASFAESFLPPRVHLNFGLGPGRSTQRPTLCSEMKTVYPG